MEWRRGESALASVKNRSLMGGRVIIETSIFIVAIILERVMGFLRASRVLIG